MNPAAIRALFEAQRKAWPELDQGVRSLSAVRSRDFLVDGVRVVAIHIPHRIKSTTAPADPEAIRARPCFLCSDNLPAEQVGMSFGNGLVVLCNPYPILVHHVTIVGPDHTPQRIVGNVGNVGNAGNGGVNSSGLGDMLAASAALPGFMVLYNGPGAGASAPDHLHFQACSHTGIPVVEDIARSQGLTLPNYLRPVLVIAGNDADVVRSKFDRLMELLARRAPGEDEPMVNLVVFYDSGCWKVLVFPRARHRPEVYHRGLLTWSPGAIDMAGVVVLPVASDLDRITGDDIRNVYAEVSIPAEAAMEVAARMESP